MTTTILSDLERDLHDDPVGPRCIRDHDWKGRPAPRQVGLLCFPCYNSIRSSLAVAPLLITWVASHRFPSITTPITQRVTGSKDPRIPWGHEASEALDDLWGVIARHVQYYAQQLSIPPTGLLWEAVERDLAIERVPANWSTGKLEQAALEAASWLDVNQQGWRSHPSAGEFHDELTEVVNRVRKRWPVANPPMRPASRPCGRIVNGIASGCGIGRVVVGHIGSESYAKCNGCGWEPTDTDEYVADAAVTERN